MTHYIYLIIYSMLLFTASCTSEKQTNISQESSPQKAFFDRLSAHCGNAYAGSLVSNDRLDSAMQGKAMVIYFSQCTDTQIRIPFHIESGPNEWNRSRTWVISRTNDGLRLKHDHRHEDGSADKVTQYGGDTTDNGSADLQNFPVDQESIDVFSKNDLSASTTNIWSVGITTGENPIYSYQMERVNRKFRVEFDLSKTIDTPPAAWGDEE